MPYTVFHPADLDWHPRREGDPRLVSELSDAMTRSRANLYRYPPGAIGRRHIDPVQEEVFVVLEGTLTMLLGDPPERHDLPPLSVVSVPTGNGIQMRNETDSEIVVFAYGAPPITGQAEYLDDVEL